MRRFHFSFLLAAAAAAIAFTSGCKKQSGSAGQADSSEIVLGEYGSLTGDTADFGQSSHAGLMLAIDQINAAGGVLGKHITVITDDDESKAEEAQNAVEKLINRDKVVAVIGEVASTRSLSGAGICQQYKIPMLSPASTNPTVTKVGDYIFRICFTDDFQGPVNAKFARNRGWKKVAILTDAASDYSKGLTKAFADAYAAFGQIVEEESYANGAKDFRTELTKIKAAGADAVFVPGYYGEVGLVLRQARELEMTMPFFGGDGWDSPETLTWGPVSDGCFFSTHYSPDDPRPQTQAFVVAYKQAHGKTPDAMAVLGYDAGQVMVDAIRRAGSTDPAAIRDALAATKDFPGASGKITIDSERNAQKPAVVLELRGGQTHLAESIEPD